MTRRGHDPEPGVQHQLDALWERYRDTNFERVASLERSIIQLLSGRDEKLLHSARRDAHKLAGVLGTFGFERASEEAIAMQSALDAAISGAPLDVDDCAKRVMLIRDDLSARSASVPTRRNREVVLLVEPDATRSAALSAALTEVGLLAVRAESIATARSLLQTETVKAVVVDLHGALGAAPFVARSNSEQADQALLLIRELAEAAPFMAIVVIGSAASNARIQATRTGAALFVDRDEPAGNVARHVRRLIDFTTRHARVIALDDDPEMLDVLRESLPSSLIDLVPMTEPARLWEELGRAVPDLVILDVEMPAVDGIEICTALRADPRYMSLPILVLTASRQKNVIDRVFAAGADDFVAKPIVASELMTRILNRLRRQERVAAVGSHARAADTVTSVALVRAPESELKRIAQTLRDTTTGPSVHFALERLLFFSDQHATGLLTRLKNAWSDHAAELAGAVCALGELGAKDTLQDVVRSLEASLANATSAEPVVSLHDKLAAGRVDVLLVEDEEGVASLLLYTLQNRGLTTQWIRDGLEAANHLLDGTGAAPRVVLLDIDLPSLNGLSVLRRIAAAGLLGRMRVIIVSVRAAESEVLSALELGAFDHIAKPFSLAVVVEKVKKALQT